MKSLQLKQDLYYIGSLDKDLRVFDIIMETEYGTSYNSYLLKTSEGIVLFETVKEKYFDDYIDSINEIASVDQVKYVVVNHTEPDHSGSISKLLALNSNIEVISSAVASRYLSEIINGPFNSRIVKDNDELSFGNYTLKFISVPCLHWPDTMYTYIKENNVLVTCDSFGAHYASDEILLSKVNDITGYHNAFNYYTTMIMGPFKPFILTGLKKIEGLTIDLIACGHGPVIDCNINETIQAYKDFATPTTLSEKSVVIPYVSCYGYTETMANIIKDTLISRGISCECYDLTYVDNASVIAKAKMADGIMYGSPTLLNDALPPIYNVMNAILQPYDGAKVVSAFGSYGWSGEAVGNMLVRLKQQRMKVADDGLKICFKPSEANIEQIKMYATNFADVLLNK